MRPLTFTKPLLLCVVIVAAAAPAQSYERLDDVSDAARFYSRPDRRLVLQAGLLRAHLYWPKVRRVVAKNGVPASLVFGLAMCESAWNPWARSPRGAEGLFQFMPRTGAHYGLRRRADRVSVTKSSRAAVRHLRDLYRHYRSWDLALAAYNAGEPRVDAAIRKAHSRRWVRVRRHLRAETYSFVPKVRYLADEWYRRFRKSPASDPSLRLVLARAGDSFSGLARRLKTTVKVLVLLNGRRIIAGQRFVGPVPELAAWMNNLCGGSTESSGHRVRHATSH